MNFKLLDPYLNINKILQMMYHLNLLWILNLATILFVGITCQKLYKIDLQTEFNKCGGPAGHQVRILWGPAEIYTLPVRMSDTIFLQY